MSEAYFVEVDDNGCAKCGGGRTWTVVGPDGAGIGTSYFHEEDANDTAEMLNDAFSAGREPPLH